MGIYSSERTSPTAGVRHKGTKSAPKCSKTADLPTYAPFYTTIVIEKHDTEDSRWLVIERVRCERDPSKERSTISPELASELAETQTSPNPSAGSSSMHLYPIIASVRVGVDFRIDAAAHLTIGYQALRRFHFADEPVTVNGLASRQASVVSDSGRISYVAADAADVRPSFRVAGADDPVVRLVRSGMSKRQLDAKCKDRKRKVRDRDDRRHYVLYDRRHYLESARRRAAELLEEDSAASDAGSRSDCSEEGSDDDGPRDVCGEEGEAFSGVDGVATHEAASDGGGTVCTAEDLAGLRAVEGADGCFYLARDDMEMEDADEGDDGDFIVPDEGCCPWEDDEDDDDEEPF